MHFASYEFLVLFTVVAGWMLFRHAAKIAAWWESRSERESKEP